MEIQISVRNDLDRSVLLLWFGIFLLSLGFFWVLILVLLWGGTSFHILSYNVLNHIIIFNSIEMQFNSVIPDKICFAL